MLKAKKVLLCLCLFAVSLNANAVTLDEALIGAYKNNAELNIQREELKISDEQIMQAMSRWLPNISFHSIRQHSKDSKPNLPYLPSGPSDSARNELTFSQNLFRSGADVASIQAAHSIIRSARARLELMEQTVFLKAIEGYLHVLDMRDSYQLYQKMEGDSVKHLEGIKHRFKVGDVTKVEVASIEAELSRAKANKSSARANYESYKANFRTITGVVADNLTLPKDNISLPKSIAEAIDISLLKNPSMIIAKSEVDASKKSIDIARGNVLPRVDLEHSVTKSSNMPTGSQAYRQTNTTFISLTVPILGDGRGGNSWSSLRIKKRETAKAQISMVHTTEAIQDDAMISWEGLESKKVILKSTRDMYEARKIAYKGMQASEKAGLYSILDIIQARNNYFSSYIEFIKARTSYITSLYKLKSVVGECTARGLGLPVEYYDPLKNYDSIKWQLIGAF